MVNEQEKKNPTVRRVVTGQTPTGTHQFTHVGEVAALDMGGGCKWYGVWGWDKMPTLPYHTVEPYVPRSVFPAAGGMRINTTVFPAGYGVTTKDALAAGPSEEFLRIMAAQPPTGEHDHETGMHSTDSVDFGFVISGEVTLIQGDGSEVTLVPGDVLVQNGAIHAWQNRSDQPCTICFVVLGTPRAATTPRSATSTRSE